MANDVELVLKGIGVGNKSPVVINFQKKKSLKNTIQTFQTY